MPNAQQYAGSRSQVDRNRSQSIWSDCKWDEIVAGNVSGVTFFEDFVSGGKITSPTTEAALVGLPISGYCSDALSGTPPAIAAGICYDSAKNAGGGLIIANTTDDNGAAWRSAQQPFQISSLLGKLWAEWRVKVSTITASELSFAIGLMDITAISATIPLVANGGALGDCNFVGFHKPEANTTTFNCSYKADGVAAVVVNTGVGALAADTYVKLGLKFDPKTGKLSFYINGVKQASMKTVPNATGTDFPADVALGPVVALGEGSGGSNNLLTTDWCRVAQLI